MSHYVLVVDDDTGIQALLTMALTSENYPVQVATNGAEALEAIQENPPSVMLLDMQMPVLDGCGVARRLHEQGERIPTIVMTAANARQRCDELGADGYIAKPFNIDELLDVLSRVADASASQQQVAP